MITLFVNPLGKNITLQVIDTQKRTVIKSHIIPKTGNDFEVIPEIFVEVAKKYAPEELWCIPGPGTFTLMRIITLILNSIAYHRHIRLKSCHYFDLLGTGDFTPILEANRHEYLSRDDSGNDILVKKDEFQSTKSRGYIDESGLVGYTPYEPTPERVIEVFQGKSYDTRLSPLYIKPPHITLGSKKTSLPSLLETKR